jgi:2-keto-3-deoxy-L-rhamnonate aldolase RhmA
VSDEDDASYRRRLVDILNQHGFDWVVAQVEHQIAEGTAGTKQVSERDSYLEPYEVRPRVRRTTLIIPKASS